MTGSSTRSGEGRMPQFQCPKCGKHYLVPLALCESLLDNTPKMRREEIAEPVFVLRYPD